MTIFRYIANATWPHKPSSTVVQLKNGSWMELRRGNQTIFAEGERVVWPTLESWKFGLPPGAVVVRDDGQEEAVPQLVVEEEVPATPVAPVEPVGPVGSVGPVDPPHRDRALTAVELRRQHTESVGPPGPVGPTDAEREAKARIDPKEMFRGRDLYGHFDADGIPTHWATGVAIPPNTRKRLATEHAHQTALHEEWLAKVDPKDMFRGTTVNGRPAYGQYDEQGIPLCYSSGVIIPPHVRSQLIEQHSRYTENYLKKRLAQQQAKTGVAADKPSRSRSPRRLRAKSVGPTEAPAAPVEPVEPPEAQVDPVGAVCERFQSRMRLYGQVDADGIPTHFGDGSEVPSSIRDSLIRLRSQQASTDATPAAPVEPSEAPVAPAAPVEPPEAPAAPACPAPPTGTYWNRHLSRFMERLRVDPKDLFREEDGLYSRFDADGIPTHFADGGGIPPCIRESLIGLQTQHRFMKERHEQNVKDCEAAIALRDAQVESAAPPCPPCPPPPPAAPACPPAAPACPPAAPPCPAPSPRPTQDGLPWITHASLFDSNFPACISPKDLFTRVTSHGHLAYSRFDDHGVPTHYFDGTPLPEDLRKRRAKQQACHVEKHAKFLAERASAADMARIVEVLGNSTPDIEIDTLLDRVDKIFMNESANAQSSVDACRKAVMNILRSEDLNSATTPTCGFLDTPPKVFYTTSPALMSRLWIHPDKGLFGVEIDGKPVVATSLADLGLQLADLWALTPAGRLRKVDESSTKVDDSPE